MGQPTRVTATATSSVSSLPMLADLRSIVAEVRRSEFRGSRSALVEATAARLAATVLLLFLLVRAIHLGQAVIDLSLAGGQFTVGWLAVWLGVACVFESAWFARRTLAARRLTVGPLLAEAGFGVAALAAFAVATRLGPSRAGSLNWMLPYTVATTTALGAVSVGSSSSGAPAPLPGRWLGGRWPIVLAALALTAAYLGSEYLPSHLRDDTSSTVVPDALDYPIFFAAGAATLYVAGRVAGGIAARNREIAAAAAEIAEQEQWRAASVDAFAPSVALIDRVIALPGGELPETIRAEAARLFTLITSIEPVDEEEEHG